MVKSRIPLKEAGWFTRWFNFNPVSMWLRWQYACGYKYGPKPKRRYWCAYLCTLDLVRPRVFPGLLFNLTIGKWYRWWRHPSCQG